MTTHAQLVDLGWKVPEVFHQGRKPHPNVLIAPPPSVSRVMFCNDCLLLYPDGYMVHNEIWLQVVKPRVRCFLCFDCLEKRLGRSLTIDDFTEAPINRAIRKGWAMAQLQIK